MRSTWKWSLVACEREFDRLVATGMSRDDAHNAVLARQNEPEPES